MLRCLAMSNASSIPVTRLRVGAAADHRLDRVVGAPSSRTSVFVPTLNAAGNAFGVPGRFAPPAARGMRAWIDGTEELRLRLHGLGWQVPERATLDAAGLVISPNGETAIAMVSGDGATGRPGYRPQVRYARGRVASEVVQGVLFEEFAEVSRTTQLWFLMHEIGLDGWNAELALPLGVGKGGWITGWRERLQIVEDRPGGRDESATDTGPELRAPTVRWRDPA